MLQSDLSNFLTEAGWHDASVTQMGADMGLRSYSDLKKPDGSRALLMDMSRAGYEASLDAYVRIGRWLNDNNIHAPEIYFVKLDKGLSLVEHLGNTSFGDALHGGEDKKKIYNIATDVLYKIRQNLKENELRLGRYKESRIWDRLSQFIDFYMPVASDVQPTQELHLEFLAVMKEIEKGLLEPVLGFCHADYHLENLIWRPDFPERYGLIDFQDAFWGPLPYDLLNLLEDARVTVPEDIKKSAKEQYCQGMTEMERESFDGWYTYLSSHFHLRVIGLFVKFSKENNSTEFLAHIPRLQNYIKGHLENPLMVPLKRFIEKYNIDLNKKITIEEIS